MEFNLNFTAVATVNVTVDVDEEAYREEFIEECMGEDEEFDQDYFESWLEEKVRDEMGYGISAEHYIDDTIGFSVNAPIGEMTAEIKSVECGEPELD